eukprot:989990_1
MNITTTTNETFVDFPENAPETAAIVFFPFWVLISFLFCCHIQRETHRVSNYMSKQLKFYHWMMNLNNREQYRRINNESSSQEIIIEMHRESTDAIIQILRNDYSMMDDIISLILRDYCGFTADPQARYQQISALKARQHRTIIKSTIAFMSVLCLFYPVVLLLHQIYFWLSAADNNVRSA